MAFHKQKYRLILPKLFLLVFCFFAESRAQDIETIGNPLIKNFKRADYQGSRQNWDISQSPKTKYIYFANSKGLLEYDGSKWRLFNFPHVLRSVLVDSRGRIFTGALGEFGEWSKSENGNLEYHSLKNQINDQAFLTESVWNIIEVPEGVLFQSFAQAYIFKKNNKIEKLKVPTNIHFFNQIYNRTVVPSIEKGIYEYSAGKFLEIPGSNTFFKNHSFATVMEGNAKNVFYGTSRGVFSQQDKEFKPFNLSLNSFLEKNKLNKSAKVNDSTFAFGTLSTGVILTDKAGEIKHIFNKNNGLINNTVLSMLVDLEGNLWVGLDDGISQIQLNNPVNFFEDISGEIGTVYDVVKFENQFFIGSNHGLFKYDQATKRFHLVAGTQGQVWKLEVIDNQLIIGHNDGTFRLAKNQLTKISDITGGWCISALKNNKNVFIQGTYTSLVLFEKNQDGLWIQKNRLSGINEGIKQLFEDAKGNIWINKATGGIAKVKLTEEMSRVKVMEEFKGANFESGTVDLFFFNQKVWVSGPGGTMWYDKKEKKFVKTKDVPFSGENARFYNFYEKYLFSVNKNGNIKLWTGGKGRIYSWLADRSLVEESENIRIIKNKQLVLCLEDGFAVGNLDEMIKRDSKKFSPPSVNGLFFEKGSSLNLRFDSLQTQKTEIPFLNNSFCIQFSPNTFSHSAKFSYLLDGVNNSWSEFESTPQTCFNNLSAGSYKFWLKSNLSDEITLFEFDVLPPWYWSIWSKILYLLLLVGLVWLLYFLQDKNIKKQKQKLELKHREEVEKQQQEIIKIRNQQLEQDIIRKSEELANSTMVLIKKNELLTKIKDEVVKESKEKKSLVNLIDSNISSSHDWKVFESNFNQVHEEFLKKLQLEHPQLSHGDLKLAAYLRMNLSTKEIAQLLNITVRSVELKRYRLRKKLNITTDENLNDLMMKI
ncbi:MAG: hypothetical protein IPH28_06520 [Cytophagaceae bacterium]|nr:hypothetical protein [Cytophagaceae bacterium]